MANKAGRLLIQMQADLAELRRDMAQATQIIDKSSNSWTKSINDFGKGFKSAFNIAAVATAAVAAIGGIGGAIRSTMAEFDKIADGSKRIAASAEEYQKLAFAFEQSGSSAESMESAIVKMQKTLGDGSKKTGEALKDLGLSAAQLRTMAAPEQFAALAGAIGEVVEPTKQAALAAAIFGRSFAELRPLMSEGEEGILALYQAAEDLGIVLGDDVVAAGEAFGDQMAVIKAQGMAVIANFLGPLIKVLNYLFTSFQETGKGAKKAAGELGTFATAAKIIGEVAGFIILALDTAWQFLVRWVKNVAARMFQLVETLKAGGAAIGEIWSNMFSGEFSLAPIENFFTKANAIARQGTEDTAEIWKGFSERFEKGMESIFAKSEPPKPPRATGGGDGEDAPEVKTIKATSAAAAEHTRIMKENTEARKKNKEAMEEQARLMQQIYDKALEQYDADRERDRRRYEEQETERQDAADRAERNASQMIDDAAAIGAAFAESSERGTEALKQLAASIIATIAKALILKWIMTSLGFVQTSAGGWASPSPPAPAGLGMAPPTVGAFAGGAMTTATATSLAATGTVSPGLAMATRGGSGSQGLKVEVNNYGGAQVEAKREGNTLRILVDAVRNTVASDIASGGNPIASAFEQTYQVRR